jgi:hypothetical protein
LAESSDLVTIVHMVFGQFDSIKDLLGYSIVIVYNKSVIQCLQTDILDGITACNDIVIYLMMY